MTQSLQQQSDGESGEGRIAQHSEKVLLSQDSMSQGGFSKLSTRRTADILSRDWRSYFNQDELEKAFQVVEIQNEDIPEEDSQDIGSDSNPSDDNLSEAEIYEKVYELPPDLSKNKKDHRLSQLSKLRGKIGQRETSSAFYQRLRKPGGRLTSGTPSLNGQVSR